MFYKGSDLLEQEEPSEAIYQKAKKLVLAIRGLSDEQRQFIEIDLYKMYRDCMPQFRPFGPNPSAASSYEGFLKDLIS